MSGWTLRKKCFTEIQRSHCQVKSVISIGFCATKRVVRDSTDNDEDRRRRSVPKKKSNRSRKVKNKFCRFSRTDRTTHWEPKGKSYPKQGVPLAKLTTVKLSRIRSLRTSGRTCVHKMCFVRFIQSFYLPPFPNLQWSDYPTRDVASGLTGWGEAKSGYCRWVVDRNWLNLSVGGLIWLGIKKGSVCCGSEGGTWQHSWSEEERCVLWLRADHWLCYSSGCIHLVDVLCQEVG